MTNDPNSPPKKPKDDCEICHGDKGGVRGNENLVPVNDKTVAMCDYCWVDCCYKGNKE